MDLYHEFIEAEPSRPCLVFLHEGLGCVAMWKDFPRSLCAATGCPGLVYDRRGHGRSPAATSRRSPYYLHEAARVELPMVLAALIPDRPYWLVGHSDGGSIALIHSADQPKRLGGVITEAAHVFVEPETLEGIRVATQAFAAGKLSGLAKYHGERTDAVFRAWSDTWLSPEFQSWSIEGLLASVTVPVLALQGSKDQYGTRAQVEAIAAQVMRGEGRILEGCGHSPHRDDPALLVRMMEAFLARTGGRRFHDGDEPGPTSSSLRIP